MKKHLKFSSLLFFVFFCQLGITQEYFLSHYTQDDGLSSDVINCIYQDSLGQVWIGSNGGLHLFDGTEFTQFKKGIPSLYIRDIEPLNNNMIAISHDAGLTMLKTGFFSFEPLQTSERDDRLALGNAYPNELYADSKKRLWVSLPNGKLLRIFEDNVNEILSEEIEFKDVQIGYSFTALNETDFFISSPNGSLYLWKEQTEELQFLAKTFRTRDILYLNGFLYVGGKQFAIIKNPSSPKEIEISFQINELDAEITVISSDTTGRIFIGTAGKGLFQLISKDSYELKEVFSNNDPHRIDRLPFRTINAIHTTNDNSIWVCSNEGLGILKRRFFEGAQNLPNDNATTLAIADNGDVYVCMGDVYRIQQIGQDYRATKLNLPNVGAFNGLSIEGNNLWAGTNNGLLVKMDLDGKLKKIFPFNDRGAGVFRICTDHQKRKWFCQAPREKPILGLAMVDKNDKVHLYGKEKGFENRMLIVKESPRKELYAAGIGRNSYLYKYYPQKDEFINMSLPLNFPVSPNFEVHDIAIDERGLVWLATTDGLLRHDMENVMRPDLGERYNGKEVRAVTVLKDGSIWLSTDIYGMLRYKEGEVLSFGEDAGLPTKIMAYRGLLMDQDSKLWINTLEGLTFTSQNLPQPVPTPRPILSAIKYQKKSLDIHKNRFELIRGGELELEFRTLSYPGNFIDYQYKIEKDQNSEWVNIDSGNTLKIILDDKEMSGIKLRGRKSGGYDWSDSLQLSTDILAPWYMRPFSLILFLILGISLVIVIWRANNKRLRKKISLLESDLKEQNGKKQKNVSELNTQKQTIDIPSETKESLVEKSLNIIYEITQNTESGMKWDFIMEHLSIAMIKLPETRAFEIGILNKYLNVFEIDGYSHVKERFYQRSEKWSKTDSIFSESIRSQEVIINYRDQILANDLDGKLGDYEVVIASSFFMNDGREAVICLYGSENLKNEHLMKALQSISNYLETIN